MSKKEVSLQALSDYLPEKALDPVLEYLHLYKIHLTITKSRKTIWGDYRYSTGDTHHRISVNGNLNPYAFLITLLHELAHLITFDRYANRVLPHGKEWKSNFSLLLSKFMDAEVFPDDISHALTRSIQNPAASCSDHDLMRALRKYDQENHHLILIEQLSEGALFQLKDGRIFKRGEKLRKRFKGVDVNTGQTYLFSALYEVKGVESH
jgi:hypothetical protein